MNKQNPYNEGTNDWISFEWYELCDKQRKALTLTYDNHFNGELASSSFQNLDKVQAEMQVFRQNYFPQHQKNKLKK